jgi:hypothetical protein
MTPIDTGRRRAVAAFAAAGAALLLPGCVTPVAPVRPLNPAQAPRAGDTWRYAYSSGWRNVPPQQVEITCVEVGTGVRDRAALVDSTVGDERSFLGPLELVERPVVPGFALVELSPYLAAFDGTDLAQRYAVRMPPANWGTAWYGFARAVGTEKVQTPAGTFEAVRVEMTGNRLFLRGQMDDAIDPVYLRATAWYAPAARRVVRFTHDTWAVADQPLSRDTYQLTSMKLG